MPAVEAGWYPLGRVGHVRMVPDGRVGGERTVDGDRDAEAGGQGPHLKQAADVSLEGEVAPFML